MTRRFWTDDERGFLRAHYRRCRTGTLAACLGRSEKAVYLQAYLAGLCSPRAEPINQAAAQVRQWLREGWSDSEIAKRLGVQREGVREWRHRRGIPASGRNERYRRRVSAKTREQCRLAGVSSLAEIRSQEFRIFAESSGWPRDLKPRAVQILNLLYERGPMTRRELTEAMGMTWRGVRSSLKSSDPEGSYLAHLMARGLVVRLPREPYATGKGKTVYRYAIPPQVVRGSFHGESDERA